MINYPVLIHCTLSIVPIRAYSSCFSCLSVAFSVNDSFTVFLIVLSGNPIGLKSTLTSLCRSTLPNIVNSVIRGDNLDVGTGWGQVHNFAFESFRKTFVHRRTTREDYVFAEISSYINIRVTHRSP